MFPIDCLLSIWLVVNEWQCQNVLFVTALQFVISGMGQLQHSFHGKQTFAGRKHGVQVDCNLGICRCELRPDDDICGASVVLAIGAELYMAEIRGNGGSTYYMEYVTLDREFPITIERWRGGTQKDPFPRLRPYRSSTPVNSKRIYFDLESDFLMLKQIVNKSAIRMFSIWNDKIKPPQLISIHIYIGTLFKVLCWWWCHFSTISITFLLRNQSIMLVPVSAVLRVYHNTWSAWHFPQFVDAKMFSKKH